MSECTKWLKEFLQNAGHEVLVDVVRDAAQKAGFTKKQLKIARLELSVITINDFEKHVGTSNRWWKLP